MKAVVYRKYGKPDVLSVAEVDAPVPKDNEVLIKVCAAEATKADCELRSFRFAVNWFWLPLRLFMGPLKPRNPVLGGYFSGVVDAVGKEVTRFSPGDRVFGSSQMRMGAYGEYLALPESYPLVSAPKAIPLEEAAAVPLGGFNALHFMRKANLQKGDKVLINGAGGSIGSFAVQIAKTLGAEVTAVDSPAKEAMLRRIGADHFIDYTRERFTDSGQTYDVIFNMVARCSYSACIRSLKRNGRYLMGNPRISDMFRATLTSRFTNKTAIFALANETSEELNTLKGMIDAGEIKPVIDRVYPMVQAAQAHQRVETEQRLGMVLLTWQQ